MEIYHIVKVSYFVTRAFTGAPLKFAEPGPVSIVGGLWGTPDISIFSLQGNWQPEVRVWALQTLQLNPNLSLENAGVYIAHSMLHSNATSLI